MIFIELKKWQIASEISTHNFSCVFHGAKISLLIEKCLFDNQYKLATKVR